MRTKSIIFLLLSVFIFVMADASISFFSAGRGNETFGDFAPDDTTQMPTIDDMLEKFEREKPLRDSLSALGLSTVSNSLDSDTTDVEDIDENDDDDEDENENNDETVSLPRSNTSTNDSIPADSLRAAIMRHNKAVEDSIRLDSINRKKSNGIESPIEYTAKDSLVYLASTKTAYLYGESTVKYQNMDLSSDRIQMSLDSNLVRATGTADTLGNITGKPVFKMGNDTYENDTMAFNMKSKKGIIHNVYTQQEDGFLTSEKAKRTDEGVMYLQHGRYTTCDQPHPDFYISLSRARVRPGKDVVFGPAHLVVCDVPLPLAIPYGFFPFTKSYSSGFIMPTYGDESSRGFYLREGGYYFAISDKMDLKVLGEIYTKGSWGIALTSNYTKRYKFRGSFLFKYQDTKHGDKGMPDFSEEESFQLVWAHSQDAKANPYHSLTANVNFATQSFEQNNLSSMYNPQARTQSTRTSSVNYNVNFSSIGLSVNSTMNIAQNMRDSSVTMTLPDINFSISRFNPFKRKHSAGEERWYEKIAVQYNGQISNSISTKENKLLHSNLIKDWRNGMQHKIVVNGPFSLFKHINITPGFNFNDRMYASKIVKSWDALRQKEVSDTVYGFNNVYDWDINISATTKIYGFWTPIRKIFGNKIQTIRHVLTPTVSYGYHPDFGASRYKYWDSYLKTDENGNVSLVQYSPYNGMLYGNPGRGKSGTITMNVSNNVEMKVLSDKDSTGIKKISLIDELGASMSYNTADKERPWGDLNTNIRLKLSKSYTFNMNAVFSTYAYELDKDGRPYVSNHTEYSKGRFGRFQGFTQVFSYELNPEKIKKWFSRGDKDDKKDEKDVDDDEEEFTSEPNIDDKMVKGMNGGGHSGDSNEMAETDPDGYMRFKMPWSLSIGYSVSMRENTSGEFNKKTMRYPYKFSQTFNCTGFLRLSDGWNINFSTGYDFDNHAVSMTRAALNRDLHCFNMSCEVVLAPYTSYNFSFRCNAATLTDALKYDKRSGSTNTIQWY